MTLTFMRIIFAATVIIELLLLIGIMTSNIQSNLGTLFTFLGLILTQSGLIYNSEYKLFKKDRC